MCFSAEASFTAAGVLLIAGAASIKNATRSSQLLFAGIPVLFSIQQFSEGILWLAFTHSAYRHWQTSALYTFLLFSQVLWPVWVPLSFLLLEKNAKRKAILSVLFAVG